MQTILVTGYAGFIGSHVCKNLLQMGHKLVGIDNFDDFYDKKLKVKNLSNYVKHQRFFFYDMDLTVKADYAQLPNGIDVVIHLAAKAG
jgi:nucleoside-diphosphate-sugar epimerase